MKKANAPTKLTVAFASGPGAGPINAIPIAPGSTTGTASYQTGFTSVNMEPLASGGVAPYGPDFNGLFNAATTAQIWQQSGYMYPYDSAFALNTNIGGYPAGSALMMSNGKGLWLNQTDNNTVNPDATGASGWLGLPAAGTSTINTTGGTTTPDPSTLGVTTLIVTGTLTSNATIILPLTAGARWIVINNTTGSFTLTVQGTSGAGVSVTSGSPIQVFTDGTNYYGVSANISGAYLPINGTAVAATKLATARTLSWTGDATGSFAFDGSANVSTALTLANSGAISGSYGGATTAPVITVNAKGIITSISNATIPLSNYLPLTGGTISGVLTVTGNLSANATLFTNTIGATSGVLSVIGNITASGALTTTSVMSSGSISGTSATFSGTINASGGTVNFGSTSGTYRTMTYLGVLTSGGSVNPTASGGAASLAFSTSGSFGGGIGLIDGTFNWGLWDTSGALNFGSGTNNGALTSRMTLSASGALAVSAGITTTTGTFSGAITATTGNFTASDERLKTNIANVEARPLHRSIPYVAYDRKEGGTKGRGTLAQSVEALEPLYIARNEDTGMLAVDYSMLAFEQSTWASNQIDVILDRLSAASI